MANKTNSDEKRLQLALALCRLLQAQEYSSISVHDIAREAGMNHGLIHYYFGSKDALLIEAIKISSDCQITLLEELKTLSEGIAQLMPPVCRKVIELHFNDGMTFREIAAHLGVSETTVYKYLRNALQQLRNHLKKDCRYE